MKKAIIVELIIMFITYLFFAFVFANINPFDWTQDIRLLLVCIWIIEISGLGIIKFAMDDQL